jgi:hypothetical protein
VRSAVDGDVGSTRREQLSGDDAHSIFASGGQQKANRSVIFGTVSRGR